MQIKTAMRYHLILVRMVFIKESEHEMLARMWRKQNPYALLLRM